MAKRKAIRNLAVIIYTLAVTFFAGKWLICMAYLERGYEAAGGEYCLILAVGWTAWKAASNLFDTMEDLEYGKKREEGRS